MLEIELVVVGEAVALRFSEKKESIKFGGLSISSNRLLSLLVIFSVCFTNNFLVVMDLLFFVWVGFERNRQTWLGFPACFFWSRISFSRVN